MASCNLFARDPKEQKKLGLVKLCNNVPKIKCWSQQVQAIFVVIIQNAIESLFLKHGTVNLDHNQKLDITLTTDKFNIIIEFYDNGIGIDKKHFKDIYCENFTSKECKTAGLDLYIVNNIIDNHNASIEIDSEKGEWTKFTIKFAL